MIRAPRYGGWTWVTRTVHRIGGAFAQVELQVYVLAEVERSFTLELKSFFGQIDELARHHLATPLDLTRSLKGDSKQFPLLGHRSAHLSSQWRNRDSVHIGLPALVT